MIGETIILFGVFFGALLFNTPIAISLGLASVAATFVAKGSVQPLIITALSTMEQKFTLTAIPFFILSAAFLSSGGTARRIVRFAMACVGHLRGGMAMAGVFACMLFAALSGSSPATVVAIGGISIKGMEEAGYPKAFAAGVICNAGTLGILIPPSIVMVVYAAATDESVGRMFMAGIVPGLLAGLFLMIGIWFAAGRLKIKPLKRSRGRELLASGRDAFFGLFLIFLILAGIYRGFFTPTEAAAFAAVYGFFIAIFIYREIGPLKGVIWRKTDESLIMALIRNVSITLFWLVPAIFHRETRKVLLDGARLSIMIMFIIFNAIMFSHVLTDARIPQALSESILGAGLAPWMFLIVINVMLLFGGQFMEPSGLLLIVAPLVYPIALTLNIDPIHLGIIMVVNMEIGMITPPVGLNLFVTSSVANMTFGEVVRAAAPWLIILLVFLILITYVPAISTTLPNYFYGPRI
jgi:C4-dicarboxylate transporter, DctM subunit